jgi:hypothetical protein
VSGMEWLGSWRGFGGLKGKARIGSGPSIHYEPKGVRLLILTLTLRIVLNFFGTIVATLRIQKIR